MKTSTGVSSMGDVAIRDAADADLDGILNVLRSSLGETALLQRTPDLFDWKHRSNPFGESIVLVAENDGQIVGVRAFMRWDLVGPTGTEIKCVRAVDTATLPEFQGQGLFRKLTLTAVDLAKDSGIDLIFNTPNDKSGPGYLKMGWGEVGEVSPIVRPRLGRVPRTPGGENPSIIDTVPGATPFGVAPIVDRSPLGLRTPRSPSYLTWRFGSHPTARYASLSVGDRSELVARASKRRGRTEVLISDLFGDGRSVRRLLEDHRGRYVAASFHPDAPEYHSCRRAGLRRMPGVPGLRLVANPLTELDIDVFDIASWDFALSDVELL